MGLQVIGAGFGRTGTLSLKLALERLGFSRCHHMQEVVLRSRQLDAWHALSRGEPADWDRLFEGYRASCDWPSAAYWEELYQHFPDSKVILTVRDEERWYRSAAETIYPASMRIPRWLTRLVPRMRKFREMVVATIWKGVFDDRFEDEAHAIQVFRDNSARVKQVVPPERLLVFEAKDGWQPLCEFLGVPVPESPYPHANEAARMKRVVWLMPVVRWLPLLALVAMVALLARVAR